MFIMEYIELKSNNFLIDMNICEFPGSFSPYEMN
jgi:hypothetical protein